VFTAVAVAAAGWVPAIVQAQRDFQDKLGLALGIVSSGVGLGMLLVVPLAQLLIDAYGWRTAFRVLAVICVVWIVPSSLFMLRRAEKSRGQTLVKKTKKSGSVPKKDQAKAGSDPSASTLAEAGAVSRSGDARRVLLRQRVLADDARAPGSVSRGPGVSAIVAASVWGWSGLEHRRQDRGGWLSDRVEREFVYLGGIRSCSARWRRSPRSRWRPRPGRSTATRCCSAWATRHRLADSAMVSDRFGAGTSAPSWAWA